MKKNENNLVLKSVEDASFQQIKGSVESGQYFKDGMNWYFFSYIKPVCDRTLMLICAIISFFIMNILIDMIKAAFPLVVSKPIFISGIDETLYYPKLVKLSYKPNEKGYDPEVKTFDDAILKYLISDYIKDREGYDYSKGEIEDVNYKMNRIKNRSSDSEYKKFQSIMNQDNPSSPINDFGRNVKKIVKIDSLKFVRKKYETLSSQVANYLVNEVPTQAEIDFTVTTISQSEDEAVESKDQKYFVKIGYEFDPIKKSSSQKDDSEKTLKFNVINYELFRSK